MLPYSMTFLIGWTLLLIVWILLGLPVGPGAPIYLEGRAIGGVGG
jgi:aminobenzoyl-glutamate transport protein